MTFPAENGYTQVRRQSASPRTVEHQVLTKIAADLESCDPSTFEGYNVLAMTIKRNCDLWTAFATDLAQDENPLPDDLKANLIKLAAYSLVEGQKVLRGEADRTVLINVNRQVATGLRNAAAKAA